MEWELIIKLTIPGTLPGLNEYINANRRNKYSAAKLKKDTEFRLYLLIKQQIPGVRIANPISLSFRFYEPNGRRDPDNVSSLFRKMFLDSLVKAQVIKDDGQRYIKGFKDDFFVDKDYPRVEVTITESQEEPK